VPVVGKGEVARYHDMHWLRIDRYFVTDKDNPDDLKGVVFQPMMCQHCDNAPCENVCPVSATNHSSEGINQMAYNRCIGTKYCANNCPYKVRHFNWMDWNDADCFEDNLYEDYKRDDINDDLTRMMLNPDVTVRSRGVMEKCSMCAQKLQAAKLDAKKAGMPLVDGAAKTACQMACSTGAIIFGDLNDEKSEVAKERADERTYFLLEDVGVKPTTSYKVKVRNQEERVILQEQIATKSKAKEEHKAEEKHS
jgi:molybdopterin-containing oxidoreductase family iron-sulfur binding subunit